MSLYRFIDKNLITRPYRLVPLLVFVTTVLYFLTNHHSPFYTFSLADPDDYMRLNETINWLQWQGWYDLSHPRLSPGAHTVIHWSRLLDMPLALMMWPFLKTWGYRSSAMLAALAEPLMLLGLLLILVPAMVRPLVGRANARLVTLFVPFVPSLLFNFSPGRVDHHNWQILIGGVGLMALQYMILCRGGWKAGIFAGVSFAIGLWISPEIMPCLILVLGCLALLASLRGGFVLRNAAVFGLALAVATVALLPAALPAAQWDDRTVSWFSSGYVIFSALTGAALIVAWLLGRHTNNKILRFTLMAALSSFAALLFVYFVPDALSGPFANYSEFNSTVALDSIDEAQPLIRRLYITSQNHLTLPLAFINFLHFLFTETLGLVACATLFLTGFSRHHLTRRRMVWAVYGLCLGGTMLLALFFQYRVLWFAQIFQLGPMTYVVWRWWSKFEGRWTVWQRHRAALITFIALIQVPVFAHMLSPDSDTPDVCSLKPAAEYIAGPWGYMNRPYTILAGADEGPELLFRTPHNVIAANFNVPANQDVYDFFLSRDDATAFNIIRKWHVDLILTCRHISSFYAGTKHPRIGKNAFLKLEPDGKLHFVSSLNYPALVERLVNGPVPGWLKPVEIPASKDYLLFEVHLPKTETQTPMTSQ